MGDSFHFDPWIHYRKLESTPINGILEEARALELDLELVKISVWKYFMLQIYDSEEQKKVNQ